MKYVALWIVQETEIGWRITCDELDVEKTVKTASHAARLIKKSAKFMAEKGISTIYKIEWEPTTRIGKMVVKAITS